MWLFAFIAFPFIIPIAARIFFDHRITWLEMVVALILGIAISSGVYFAGRYTAAMDVEIWNGEVRSKARERVSCEHSYSCNCRQSCSGSGSSQSCYETCDTCYEHSNDYDWIVNTNIGKITINRIDRQGVNTPPRWIRTVIGEPVAQPMSYINWIQAVPESLFNSSETSLSKKYKIPLYPEKVYDYWHIDRVLNPDGVVPSADVKALNNSLAHTLKLLGPQRQANVVVVFTKQEAEFSRALEVSWLRGNKNDIVVVIGMTTYPEIMWVDVFSWSSESIHDVSLRDGILEMKSFDQSKFISVLEHTAMKHFIRKPMKEYEYLKDEVDPPLYVVLIGIIISLLVSGGLSYYFSKIDLNSELSRMFNTNRRF